ncbi:RBBP9/YdeN family alpha/beta hydrolase [Pseudoduganella namucuonensis]|uniref:Alpha/beta hydrolase n=1 Tax=Pseudoduganella namucuonensis TaxID=1035707 RepID=A0A1I7LR08_9BURK|nr:alpha/beta hydrolase [Pseudoduganella namucuonensis]SFV12000.1 hypothetical protein SAMN05216552_103530 [Pseudoduganella namucuonensis]
MAATALSRFRVLVAPGLHGSGPAHWQSRWERLYPEFERIEQDRWDQPVLPVWSARVDRERGRDRRPTLVVAHSFGALATVHSLARDGADVAGALLVAPADPDKFGVAALLPREPLPCPAVMIASANDPWMTAEKAALWAGRWGCEFINAGALGHINAESGLGDWPSGQRQLQILAERAHNEHPANVF